MTVHSFSTVRCHTTESLSRFML